MTERRWLPHAIALAITIPFGVWIALSDIRGVLSPVAWLLPLAGAYFLGLRIGRETLRGIQRRRGDGDSFSLSSDGDDA